MKAHLSRGLAFGLAAAALLLGGCDQAVDARRYHLRILGDAAVLPLAEAVGQRLLADLEGQNIEPPVFAATGNDEGFARLCGGTGPKHDDMVVAPRRMTASEYARCAANNVRDVVEVPAGLHHASGEPVYLYLKALHAYGVPWLHDYLLRWPENWDQEQLLASHGLRPLDPAGRAQARRLIEDLVPLDHRSLS